MSDEQAQPAPSSAPVTGDADAAAPTQPAAGNAPPGQPPSGTWTNFRSDENPGDSIGPFRLMQIIGEGGFGTVWLAERRHPMVQRVALKIIKQGMDTRAVVARFEQERQALAVMDHPNVAKVFDAGATPSGRPYFVMEHVPGEAITTYADRHNLSVRQRLELFIFVCDAVQHAHHKGIIHRDLKPSNILIAVKDGKALAKIIDFGVAKAISHTLTDKTIFTETGQLIGTPEYMSPEQAEMGATDIDTRTDVYSLGVVLYELLSGLLPFDSKSLRAAGYDAIRKILREQDAPKPSTRLSTADDETGADIARHRVLEREQLSRELRRELDWIPLKALRKDRTARYDSPADLAKDIRRYLDGQPLEAGPESAFYRLKKLIRRNRGSALAAAAVFLALLLGVGGTLWQAYRASDRAMAATTAEAQALRLAASEREARELAESKTAEALASRLKAVEAGETIEYNSYVANIEMASAAMDFRQFDRARRRLDACPTRLRGWEWDYLDACVDTSLFAIPSQSTHHPIACVSDDGRRIAVTGSENDIQIWDTDSHLIIARLFGHTDRISTIEFSPDGSKLLTASRDATARVWESDTGLQVISLEGHSSGLLGARFSSDGMRSVTFSGDSTAKTWDIPTGQSISSIDCHGVSISVAEFSSDGSRILLLLGNGTVQVFDSMKGSLISSLNQSDSLIRYACFSTDGRQIATASDDKTITVWEVSTGRMVRSTHSLEFNTDQQFRWLNFVSLSNDGCRVLYSSHSNVARINELNKWNDEIQLEGHSGYITATSFSLDGRKALTGSVDKTARVWDSSNGALISELRGHVHDLLLAKFAMNSSRVFAAAADGSVRLWNADTPPNPRVLWVNEPEGASNASFSPDGRIIVCGSPDGPVIVWDSVTNLVLNRIDVKNRINSCIFSPNGSRLVIATDSNIVVVLDAISGKLLGQLVGHSGSVRSVAYSHDGKKIATGSDDKKVHIWDANSFNKIHVISGHSDSIRSVTFSQDDSKIVSGSFDDTVRIWDTNSLQQLESISGHDDVVTCVTFSPNGLSLATSAGDSDSVVKLWDGASGELLVTFAGHEGGVRAVAFSPDGSRLATASDDKTVRLWDVVTGVCVLELKGHQSSVRSVQFSRDGRRLVSASADGSVRLWESVPYRLRYGQIERARSAFERVLKIVESRLALGESPVLIEQFYLADKNTTWEMRSAVLAYLFPRVVEDRKKANQHNVDAWRVVIAPSLASEAIATALANARQAVELAPDDGFFINTLGVALFRSGSYEEALETLTRSNKLNSLGKQGPQPADTAFIAMAHWQLNHHDQARTALAKLQALAASDRWKDDQEARAFLKEAEALITPAPAPK